MAIAIDNAVDGGNNGGSTNSLTYSHQIVSPVSPALIVCFLGDSIGGNDDITSVTYSGSALTLVAKTSAGVAGNRIFYVYRLLNAPSGIANVVINCTHNHYLLAVSASYSGVLAIDNFSTYAASATSPYTTSLTTIANQCWVILCDGGFFISAGTGSTTRVIGAAFNEPGIFDTNGPISPAGSVSMSSQSTGVGSVDIIHIMLSLSPVIAPVVTSSGQINSLLSPITNVQTGPGISMQANLLTQGVSSPQALSILIYEITQNLQAQINSIFQVLRTPAVLQQLSIASADIANLNVGLATGPGQLNVYGGPPTFPLVGWAGTDPGSLFGILNISNITAGVVTTTTNHNLAVNDVVVIAGTSNASDNGTFVVATTPLATTFTASGISGSSSNGTVQRQGVGGWFKTIAIGGSSYADVVTNQDGMWVDEQGRPHVPGKFVNQPQLLVGPNGSLVLTGFTWTSQSPSTHHIAWTSGVVSYKDTLYTVASGNADGTHAFIYWQLSSPNAFQASIAAPTLGIDDFLVAVNSPDGSAPGALGTYSPVEELHNANNDVLVLTPGSVEINGFGNKAAVQLFSNDSASATPYGLMNLLYNGVTSVNAVNLNCNGGTGAVNVANAANLSDNSAGSLLIVGSTGGALSLVKTNGTTGFGIVAGNGSQTSATAGTHGAVPVQVAGYYTVVVDGSNFKIPYFNV